MCGIVGLFIKNPKLEPKLGELLSEMLIEMTERGPDSAGVAIYRNPVADRSVKFTLLAEDSDYPWDSFGDDVKKTFSGQPGIEVHLNHAVVTVGADADQVQAWLTENHPELRINSSGQSIEIYKEKGLAVDFVKNFEIEKMQGTHALGHTRMATESAITTIASHPFSTGLDLCLVHNGSLSNHNRLREQLKKDGINIQTDNDTEVAAGYLFWRMREGDTLEKALQHAIDDLDGFYTFAIGSKDGFAVMRDPIGCKPAVMAETDDWAAMSSEFRAIAVLPGVENARIWEPEPTQIYSWKRG
ncbi:MAG: amidophosphoribosyltransferase [Gammaproteobacteria bacterium]|nr:MAG: amidophosphoribosyltransferase [Gammaproteobacteria bacterium]